MGLERYKRKRTLEETPEPDGKIEKEYKKRFVVQKHAASHLHYDFRLEFQGVLKSWAVPKGPSLDPSVKRLAMMVEDHPIEYQEFEGVIPPGNYGAGTVMIWDKGSYQGVEKDKPLSEAEMAKKLKAGELSFTLDGQKLKGEFAIVKTKRAESSWLLFKKKDRFADKKDILEEDYSAKSGREFQEIQKKANEEGSFWQSEDDLDLSNIPTGEMPHLVKPVLAEIGKKSFSRPDWIYELKIDGYRAIAEVRDHKVSLYSRNLLSFDKDYPSVVKSLEGLSHDLVIDGEITVIDEEGRSNFGLLQNYLRSGEGNLIYFVFDLLWLDGHDFRQIPLAVRKKYLKKVLPSLPNLQYLDEIEEKGEEFFRLIKEKGLEGMMAKEKRSGYKEGKRVRSWLKIRNLLREEAVIGGFTEPKGGRKNLGALVLGRYRDGELVYVGHTGTGFTDERLKETRKTLEPLEQDHSSFLAIPKTNAPVHWVRPELVAEIEFKEWTQDGKMRQPVFLGIRKDKDPREIKI